MKRKLFWLTFATSVFFSLTGFLFPGELVQALSEENLIWQAEYSVQFKDRPVGKVILGMSPHPENNQLFWLWRRQTISAATISGLPPGTRIEEATLLDLQAKLPLSYQKQQIFGNRKNTVTYSFDYQSNTVTLSQTMGDYSASQTSYLSNTIYDPLSLLFLILENDWEEKSELQLFSLTSGLVEAKLKAKELPLTLNSTSHSTQKIELKNQNFSQILYLDREQKYIVKVESTAPRIKIILTGWQEKEIELPEIIQSKLRLPEPKKTPVTPPKEKSDLPFTERQAFFYNQNLRLAGTLTLPSVQSGPFPAVLIIGGSGPLDRNGNIPGSIFQPNLLQALAHNLSAAGFLTFRYDKRGVGQSSGDYTTAGFFDLIEDARCALSFLKKQPAVELKHISILGHSEGGMIAYSLTAEEAVISALILLATPAKPLVELVKEQTTYLYLISGITNQETIKKAIENQEKIVEAIKEGKTTVEGISIPLWKWWKEHLEFQPLEFLEKVQVPTLILQGGKDYQVTEEDADILISTLEKNGVPAKKLIFPELDHFFRPTKSEHSSPEEYLSQKRVIPPYVFQEILDWLETTALLPNN
ncbi:MAG: uncharacterized protein PWP04_218 [Candidatus Atribacteria bacterium]|nr:uncharacterized protein [Candidatus Atribacteria bacterium]